MSHKGSDNLSSPPRQRRDRRLSPNPLGEEEEHPATRFPFPNVQPLSLRDIDIAKGVISDPSSRPQDHPSSNMSSVEDQLAEFRRIAEVQQQQLQQFQQHQLESQRQFEIQQQESQRRYEQSQATVAQLSAALETLTAHTASLPTAIPTPQRKKPELPPFDPKHINRWVDRLNAAYQRAGVTLAKDKFAFLESTFEVSSNPRINKFLYGTNTNDDWNEFISFLKEEYGKTKRQKAALLITEFPRQGLRPSQYMAQMNEDTEGISLDDIKKEHLLKSLPPRVRELLGKQVEDLTSEQVAIKADEYFDKQGNLLERTHDVHAINVELPAEPTQDENDYANEDINHIRRPAIRNSSSRPGRSESRYNRAPSGRQARSSSRPGKLIEGLCRSHHKFGDDAYTCVAEGCRKQNHPLKKPPVNSKGERRQ